MTAKNSDYRILRPAEAAHFLGISTTTLWRLSKQADFPRRVKIGSRAVGYRSDELANYANAAKSE